MAKLKSLFASKKNSNTDGQEEYFREDFPPVANKSTAKKSEKKATEPKKTSEAKKPATKTEAKKTTSKSAAKAEPKKAAAKSADATKKAASKLAVKAEKPATKKAEPKKTAAKAEPKKAAAKPAVTTKKATTKPKKAPASEELYDDSPEVKGAVAVKESRESANGKWDIKRAKDGRFFFSLYASNHVVIAYSQIYSSLTAVTTGINSVIANAAKAETEDTTLKKTVSLPCPKWEIYLDKAEQYRFRLYAPNGLCICHSSHGYSTKGGCKGGIESIKRFASEEASVNKLYLK